MFIVSLNKLYQFHLIILSRSDSPKGNCIFQKRMIERTNLSFDKLLYSALIKTFFSEHFILGRTFVTKNLETRDSNPRVDVLLYQTINSSRK